MLTASCLHEILKPCNEIAFQRDLDAALPHAWLQGSLGMWPCTVRVPVSESAGTSVAAWALDWSLGSLSHIVCVGATKAPAAFDQNILLVAVLAESSLPSAVREAVLTGKPMHVPAVMPVWAIVAIVAMPEAAIPSQPLLCATCAGFGP